MNDDTNYDLSLISGAIAGALRYGDIKAANELAALGTELAYWSGDNKGEIYRKIHEAAGYIRPTDACKPLHAGETSTCNLPFNAGETSTCNLP